MKKWSTVFVAALMVLGAQARSQTAAPIKLAQTYELPTEVKGNFDHFGIDLKGGRLFATPEGYHAVVVFDLRTGKLVHKIDGIGKPHAVLYREDLNRIYITDGDAGDLKVFDGTTYKLVSSVKLLEDADSIGYDPNTKYLYIDNGGGDVHQTYSMLSVADTTAKSEVDRPQDRRRNSRSHGAGEVHAEDVCKQQGQERSIRGGSGKARTDSELAGCSVQEQCRHG